MIRVAGIDVGIDRREASRRLGFVPDEPLLYAKMSALENVNRFALLWGVPAKEARTQGEVWLKQVGLWNERNVLAEEYSRGMRQKLAVVLALLHRPSVLVLDEPFNGLDLGAALWLRELLQSRARQGDCVLLSSHQPDALDAVSDKLAVLNGGRIVRELDRAELTHEGGSAKVFLSTVALRSMSRWTQKVPRERFARVEKLVAGDAALDRPRSALCLSRSLAFALGPNPGPRFRIHLRGRALPHSRSPSAPRRDSDWLESHRAQSRCSDSRRVQCTRASPSVARAADVVSACPDQ